MPSWRTRPCSPPISEKSCERPCHQHAAGRSRPARVSRAVARPAGRDVRRPRGWGHRAPRPERRRQDDDAPRHPRPRPTTRLRRARGAGADRASDTSHHPGVDRLRPRGPRRLHRSHGCGEPPPRRARRESALRPRLRALPRARGARAAARRHAVRRPAADGRDRARAPERQPNAARRRADQGTRARARRRRRPRARAACRADDGAARRAEPRCGAAPRARRDRPRPGPRRASERRERAARAARSRQATPQCRSPRMSTFLLLTITGFGLGAMYFLIASGLSLIYGLMGVLNFAHGAFITVGSYGTWWFSTNIFDGIDSLLWRWILSSLVGLAIGGVFAALVELILIRPLYSRHIEQVLVTVGLQLAFVALVRGIWGPDAKTFVVPPWLHETTDVAGAHIPNDRWVEILTAGAVLSLLQLFLRKTRYGLIIRAGVENRSMVQALGIDVRKAFTLVFAVGGVAAAIAGVLS